MWGPGAFRGPSEVHLFTDGVGPLTLSTQCTTGPESATPFGGGPVVGSLIRVWGSVPWVVGDTSDGVSGPPGRRPDECPDGEWCWETFTETKKEYHR